MAVTPTEITPPAEEGPAPEGAGIVIPAETEPPPETPPEGDGKPSKTFSAADIEKARREEKDKLYGRLQGLEEELKAMRTDREKQSKAEETARKKAEDEAARLQAEADKKAEEEMGLKDLLTKKETEWEARLRGVEEERERDRELLAMERRYSELQAYRQQRLDAEAENIMPELRDLVAMGNTEAEIDASIEGLKERTNKIVEQMAAAAGQQRQSMRGSTVTAPPVGPLEAQQEFQTLTNDDLKSMDIATYAKMRDRLLGAVSTQVRSQGPYGR